MSWEHVNMSLEPFNMSWSWGQCLETLFSEPLSVPRETCIMIRRHTGCFIIYDTISLSCRSKKTLPMGTYYISLKSLLIYIFMAEHACCDDAMMTSWWRHDDVMINAIIFKHGVVCTASCGSCPSFYELKSPVLVVRAIQKRYTTYEKLNKVHNYRLVKLDMIWS
jgi:hypothetical protein